MPLNNLVQSLFVLLLGVIPIARGTDISKNYFTSPASNSGINLVWTLGDTQVVSWETTLGVFNLSIWQQSLVQESAASQGNVYAKIHDSDQVTDITWAVQLYGFDLDYSNVFFFWINPDGPDGFVSSFFNITEPESTSTSTPTTSAINAASTSTSSQTSSSSANTPPAKSTTGLSTNGKIALGIGIGIGVPILVVLAALVWLKSRQVPNNTGGKIVTASDKNLSSGPTIQQQQPIPPPPPNEVHGTDPRDYYPELPSQQHPG